MIDARLQDMADEPRKKGKTPVEAGIQQSLQNVATIHCIEKPHEVRLLSKDLPSE